MSLPASNRKVTLLQATAINMIDMVGIGPFVVMPLVIQTFNNNLFIWAWVLGAITALIDGMIWSELGAKYPLAGGTYNFHRVAFGEKGGRLMSFLFVWQTSIMAPLVLASGVIGFVSYLKYFFPEGGLSYIEGKLIGVGLIMLITFCLYRKIETIGKISVFLGCVVISTILWIIFSGFTHHQVLYTAVPTNMDEFFKAAFWIALGQASGKTVYSYLGYYNVCHLGGEIINPQKNIPRSIFISIFGIAILYLCMNVSIVGVLPWQDAQHYEYIVSKFFEAIYGNTIARIATVLILIVAFSSLFAVLLGYSRVPYAAALDGNFFHIFGKLHPTRNFPYISLLFIAGLGIVFSFAYSLKPVIAAILAMRIPVQFMAQGVGIILLRKKYGSSSLPFKMWLYPIPIIVSLAIWAFLFYHTQNMAYWGTAIALTGVLVYFIVLNKKPRPTTTPTPD
ncbi:MAG TPA: APC family permease [Chitinophagaceae bacterium]|jgi:amino acid transporter|nr:APC family permease [Chitinophagaceae bacterium]